MIVDDSCKSYQIMFDTVNIEQEIYLLSKAMLSSITVMKKTEWSFDSV